MKKVHIEEIDKMMNPGDRICSRAHWEKNGPMLLDALKYADNLLRDRYDHNSPCIIETIEAASFVLVEE